MTSSNLLERLEHETHFSLTERAELQQMLSRHTELIEPLRTAAHEIAEAFPDASDVELTPAAETEGCTLLIHLPQLPCIEERRQLLDDFALRWWRAAAKTSLPARRLTFDIG